MLSPLHFEPFNAQGPICRDDHRIGLRDLHCYGGTLGSISKDTGLIFTQKHKDLQLLVLRGCSMFKDSEEFCVVHILNRFAVKMWFQGLLGMGFSSFEAWERCDPVDMICNLCFHCA